MPKSTPLYAGVRSQLLPLGSGDWTFESVLRRVLALSQAAELERDKRGESKGSASGALRIFVRTLDGEIRQKLETLMRAGHAALPLGSTSAAVSDHGSEKAGETRDLFEQRVASLENLRRGHALACATRFDLESKISAWQPSLGGDSLDERVWLRFGRELASSTPSDWACLARVGPGKELEALYLRRGDRVWWSFDTLIDRPSTRSVAQRFESLRRRRSRLVPLALDALVGRRCRSDRPALRRAAMAMSARLGSCRGA